MIDKDGPMFAAVPCQIPLAIAIDVEAPRHAPAVNGRLPDGGVDRPSSPRDVARQTHVDGKQMRHRSRLPRLMRERDFGR